VPLQLFSVLALALLLGVGVDYGIFLLEHPGDGVSWTAIVLGAASTLLAFGLLALSSTPALHAFGMTMLSGWARSGCCRRGFARTRCKLLHKVYIDEPGTGGRTDRRRRSRRFGGGRLLRKRGIGVLVIEKETFPFLDRRKPAAAEHGLHRGGRHAAGRGRGRLPVQERRGLRARRSLHRFRRDKFSPGWGTTYQVQRAHFDDVLIREAQKQGAEVRFRHVVEAVDVSGPRRLSPCAADGQSYAVQAKFLLDASGFGRILPRLLDLESPSTFRCAPPSSRTWRTAFRPALSTATRSAGVHPEHVDVWYWTIPFSNGRCSQGVVAEIVPRPLRRRRDERSGAGGRGPGLRCSRMPMGHAGARSSAIRPTSARCGAMATRCWQRRRIPRPGVLVGRDHRLQVGQPCHRLLARQLAGDTVDWEAEYAQPAEGGRRLLPRLCRSMVRGSFQKLIFHPDAPDIRA
jgi:hypothetical protein